MALEHQLEEPERPTGPDPLHPVTWGVARANLLTRGERRMEADSYLSDGYGLRLSMEARSTGWRPMGTFARVWQPNRLKGIVVPSEKGVPFLSAGQVFEARPSPRKWLSLQKTPDAANRFVEGGVLLLSCSGTVGKVLAAYRPHTKTLITHDLLRIEPPRGPGRGWLYAYMRTKTFVAMATGAKYGHMIKHLEAKHVSALPVVDIGKSNYAEYDEAFEAILANRNRADELFEEANSLYAKAANIDLAEQDEDVPYTVRASQFLTQRRRLDGYHHNPIATAILEGLRRSSNELVPLPSVTNRVWWPGRFSRVFGESGTPYVSAVELFDTNPPISKFIYSGLVKNADDYFLKPGWLVMARSGQTYGLNGRVFLASERHRDFFVSEDLIRIDPDVAVIRPGYLLTVLSHPTLGRPLVLRHAYGTSIPHLEPSDLADIQVPRFAQDVEDAIAEKAERAAALFSEADELEDKITQKAEDVIQHFLHNDLGK